MSTFTSVLKKIGQGIITGGGIAAEVLGIPFLSTLFKASPAGAVAEVVLGDLSKVAQIVSVVETAYTTIDQTAQLGSAKLKAATPFVQQIILQWAESNLPGHNKLKVDGSVFAGHVGAFTSAFVDILNDFGD